MFRFSFIQVSLKIRFGLFGDAETKLNHGELWVFVIKKFEKLIKLKKEINTIVKAVG